MNLGASLGAPLGWSFFAPATGVEISVSAPAAFVGAGLAPSVAIELIIFPEKLGLIAYALAPTVAAGAHVLAGAAQLVLELDSSAVAAGSNVQAAMNAAVLSAAPATAAIYLDIDVLGSYSVLQGIPATVATGVNVQPSGGAVVAGSKGAVVSGGAAVVVARVGGVFSAIQPAVHPDGHVWVQTGFGLLAGKAVTVGAGVNVFSGRAALLLAANAPRIFDPILDADNPIVRDVTKVQRVKDVRQWGIGLESHMLQIRVVGNQKVRKAP